MVNNNNFFVPYETDSQIEGVLIKNKPLILNPDMQQILEQKGFGEWEKNKFVLKPFEVLYLIHTGKSTIFKGKKKIGSQYTKEA